MRPTFHLVPVEVWTAADRGTPYAAASLARDPRDQRVDRQPEGRFGTLSPA
jgi:hypothetical protein